ncbi:MAG TPA: histidine kinase [Gaiellaceae bacterium]|nr:histidine kinase [Gaiellaceae bacterium]
MNRRRSQFQAWLWGEILLAGLLSAGLALFIAYPELRTQYDEPQLRLVLTTTTALAGLLVALLAAVRFSVEGRRTDLLLASGFFVASLSAAVFFVGPMLAGGAVERPEGWTAIAGSGLGQLLVAAAPFLRGRIRSRDRAIVNAVAAATLVLAAAWTLFRFGAHSLPALASAPDASQPFDLTTTFALQALLELVAVVGWGLRYRQHGDDLARWLALGFTLQLFASLDLARAPLYGTTFVAESDFLVVLSFALMLFGTSRAILAAEFGRAVAEERARVAREIHDGLAQYLFAVSTHAQMLASGAAAEEIVPQLRQAAALAQQEARFAILALSSASGTAPFDAALRRYVEILTADGSLDVELEVDPAIRLAPDEQIEIFRIVQEGLANVRKHARATRAWVTIAQRGSGERHVTIRDDGTGFDDGQTPAGQGLRNMKARAESIQGGFSLRTRPGRGTALEVVLRT